MWLLLTRVEGLFEGELLLLLACAGPEVPVHELWVACPGQSWQGLQWRHQWQQHVQ